MIKRTRMPRISRIQFEWCSPTDYHGCCLSDVLSQMPQIITDFFLLITDLSEFTEAAPLRYSEIWLIWCLISCSQCKPRRLWRLAVATQPPIAGYCTKLRITVINQRRVPRGHVTIRNPLQVPKERSCGISITSPSLGSTKRNPQLILNLLAVRGCVATARRHSLLGLFHSFPSTKNSCLHVFLSEITCSSCLPV